MWRKKYSQPFYMYKIKDSNVVSVWADLEGIYGVMVLGVLYS